MDDPLQARAYAEADFAPSDQAFCNRILALLANAPQGDEGPPKVVDLGCGPGNISFRLAAALPQSPVLGLDGARQMLALAERQRLADPPSWPLLSFHHVLLPCSGEALGHLPAPFAPPYSVIVSNSLLHHLHDPAVLWHTVRQLGAPGALVVVRDLRRPANDQLLQALVARHVANTPAVLRRDFANSLAAAFRPEEVAAQLKAAGLAALQVSPLDDRYLEVWGLLPP